MYRKHTTQDHTLGSNYSRYLALPSDRRIGEVDQREAEKQGAIDRAIAQAHAHVFEFFCEECAKHGRRTAVYRMFDRDDTLLYVGISSTPKKRFDEHLYDKPWFDDVARVDLEHYANRDAARRREALLIPQAKYNKARQAAFFDAPDIGRIYRNLLAQGVVVEWPYDRWSGGEPWEDRYHPSNFLLLADWQGQPQQAA